MRIYLFLLLLLLVSCNNNQDIDQIKHNNDKINFVEPSIIKYERGNVTFESYLDPRLRQSFTWINENIPNESIFLSWWDYGHMIRAYTRTDVIIFSPSEEILYTLASGRWNESAQGKLSDHQKILDVADAFTSDDFTDTIRVMKKYNSEYIFVTKLDESFAQAIFEILHLEVNPNSTLLKAVRTESIEGFKIIYEDNLVRIYEFTS